MQAWIKIFVMIFTLSTMSHAHGLAKDFALRIEKWVKGPDGTFGNEISLVRDNIITLLFDHSSIIITFDGFTLDIDSYAGIDNASLTIEQNLYKPDHPFNDPVVGISRNHFTIKDPRNVNQISYINYYVNIDENTKYRIRLWDTLPRD